MAFFTASRTLPLTALLAVAALAGCKDKKADAQPGLKIPAAPAAYVPVLPAGAKGQLLIINNDFRFYKDGTVIDPNATESTPLQSIVRQEARAVFLDGGVVVDAGAVSLNGIGLDKSAENQYAKVGDFFFRQGFTWKVDGAGNVGSFTYANYAPLASYTGNIPATINKGLNLTIPLGGSNIGGADSTVVTIRSGSGSIVRHLPYTVGTNVRSSLVLLPADLANLAPSVAGSNAANISVAVFRKNQNLTAATNTTDDLVVLNGRPYAIVREAVVTVPVAIVEK